MVQKSAKEEEVKDKGSKYRIYTPVYMELHNWGQIKYLLSVPLISSSFALFLHPISTEWICWKSNISAVACAPNILAYVYLGHWNQHAITSSHYTFRCWKVADITSYSLVLVPFLRFFITTLHHLELHYNASQGRYLSDNA